MEEIRNISYTLANFDLTYQTYDAETNPHFQEQSYDSERGHSYYTHYVKSG